MNWDQSIWFFDVDDTLINTDELTVTGAEGVKSVFENNFDEKTANNVKDEFIKIFDTILAGYRIKQDSDWDSSSYSKHDVNELLNIITNYQSPVQEQWDFIKKWSREVFVKIAADRSDLQVSPELVHEAADAYWLNLGENTTVFPDAKDFFTEINNRNRPIFLITSSDGRLRMRSDGLFEYDPEYSKGLKRQRMEFLREKGLQFRLMSIGDPEDKPHRDFFEKGLKLAEEDLGHKIETKNCLMFGDSYAGDLATPREILGFGMVVLREKDRKDTQLEDENYISTGNMNEVLKYMK